MHLREEVTKEQDIQNDKTIIKDETSNNSGNTNNEKKTELQLLDEIQKEFVAFLLPWLKLVPNTPNSPRDTEYNTVTTEEKNKAWRNIVLKNLSKV